MIDRLKKALFPVYSAEQEQHAIYRFSLTLFIDVLWLLTAACVVYYLQAEKDKGFDQVALILAFAFPVYMLMPLKFRKTVLVGLAVLIEYYLFGFKIAIGVLCFISFFTSLTYIKKRQVRLFMVLFSVALCMLITSKVITLPFFRLIILSGAIFLMLRYVYFMYELRFFKTAPVFIDRLCYFFLIPNACFPLFPALSPVEFLKTYYDRPSGESLRRGLHWITTGVIHLLIYRMIYLYFSPSPYDIDGFGMWLWFILSAYSLIFRLSGLFYMASGFLQIFGFKLPPIFDHVYFATSFPDLWRRVNLYWRAFMMRVFYYPLVLKFKKQRQSVVIFFSVMAMFVCTWLLHSWQWYWIKGTWYFYPTDMLFWLILGLIISSYSLLSYVRFSKKGISEKKNANYFVQSAKVIMLFFAMSFLWSLWTSSSLTEFIYLAGFARKITGTGLILSLGIIIGVIICAGILRMLYFKYNWFAFIFRDIKPVFGISLCMVLLLGGELLKRNGYAEEVDSFLSVRMNNKDKQVMERGYYEQILNNSNRSIELLNADPKLKKWNLDRDAYVRTNNVLIKEFLPAYKTTFKGDTLYTNSLGMRDDEIKKQKEPGVIRLAFVGGSYVMGSGVSNEENFPALIEKKLKNTEVLNYGAGGYFLIQNVYVVQHKIEQLNPDYLFLFIHSSYRWRTIDNFATLIEKQVPLTYPFLQTIAEKAGAKKGMCHLELYNRLKPYTDSVFKWAYSAIIETCRQKGIIPVAVYLPASGNLKIDPDKTFCISEAGKAGFFIIDLSHVYDSEKPENIQLSWWDTHPNEKGHRLISDSLYENLKRNEHFFKFMQ